MQTTMAGLVQVALQLQQSREGVPAMSHGDGPNRNSRHTLVLKGCASGRVPQ